MEKQLIIKQQTFIFNYREDNEFWYIGKNEFDIFDLGYSTDITINEPNPNWEDIESFLKYILKDNKEIAYKLTISNERLKEIFKDQFIKNLPHFKYEDLFFTLSNIEYLGKHETKFEFKYILNFNAESKSDADFFTYNSWNAIFEDEYLVNVFKS